MPEMVLDLHFPFLTHRPIFLEAPVKRKKLYDYQEQDLSKIYDKFKECPTDYKLLYQLPTGGGKTVIFSEISRKYISETGKKAMILTHRIELCSQTSKMLAEFGVNNMIINSAVKEVPADNDFMCYVAMVETLNNRIQEDKASLENIGLVIVDEAHYNSFRKLFKYFENCFMLGVTATPLSSNIKLPMKNDYKELIVGTPIAKLVADGFLAKANTYTYDVELGTLKVGINGDYTVKSSESLYGNVHMQSKLIYAYEQRAKGKKVLIFNNGIKTSKQVFINFQNAGYEIRHLDSTMSKKERTEVLEWFKTKPDAILTSVSILTTGFDEPSIQTIVLNRATKSPTLYYQMIGRGSRVLPEKKLFDVIDLGNNVARFGLWEADLDWQYVFKNPNFFLETIISDEEIERRFRYIMPDELRVEFAKTEKIDFDIDQAYQNAMSNNQKSSVAIDKAIEHHAAMCIDNSNDLMEAFTLLRKLEHDIHDKIRRYCYCIANTTRNYRDWLYENYRKQLRTIIKKAY